MLSWKITGSGQDQQVSLSGDVTESSGLEKLNEQIPGPRVTFDLSEVKRLNSMGVHSWLVLMSMLRDRGIGTVLTRCSVPVVEQISMIVGFEGTGTCLSAYAPYYCEACNNEERVLLDVGPDLLSRIAGTMPCKKCGGEMIFDDVVEHYERLATLGAG